MGTHDDMAVVAEDLIEANGKPLILTRLSSTPTDADQPWRGTQSSGTVTVTPIGVITNSNVLYEGGGTAMALIAARSVGDVDLTLFDRISDGTDTWEIKGYNAVAPGTTRILWRLTLNKL